MAEFPKGLAGSQWRLGFTQREHGETMLGDAKRMVPCGVSAPTVSVGEANREVLVCPRFRLWVKQVEPTTRLEENPCA